MKQIIRQIISHPLFSSSFVMIAGTNSINAINYVYHLVMGRMLGPAAYGELSAFFSLIGLLSIVPMSFGTVVIKFIASSKNNNEVASFVSWFLKPVIYISIALCVGVLVFSQGLARYLNTDNLTAVVLIALSFLFALPSALYRSALQGLIKFPQVVISLVSETTTKLLAGIILVWFGFGVSGAVGGLILAVITGWLISYSFIKKYTKSEKIAAINPKEILIFSLPVLLQTAAMTSLMSIDVVLVKHFFPDFEAGIYAAVSTLGKILLFASAPVATVMFPIVTARYNRGEKYISIFLLSLLMTVGGTGLIIFVYATLPELVINMLYGSKYLPGSYLVVPYAIYAALLAVGGLFINLYLSMDRKKVIALPVIAAVAQIIGIELYHQDLFQVVLVCISVAALLVGGLGLYFLSISSSRPKNS